MGHNARMDTVLIWPYPAKATISVTPAQMVLTPAGEIEGVHLVHSETGRMYEYVDTADSMDRWQLIETDKEPGGGSG